MIEVPTIGVEEEYLLVDVKTRDLCRDPPADFMRRCAESLGERVTAEFLRCQVEVGTPVCETVGEARGHLARFRRVIAQEASEFGLAPIAASTHPFAEWDRQLTTDKERYLKLAQSYRAVAERQLICGMHVHAAVADEDLRVDLHAQLPYFLPHLLALSTSSPFWRGRPTGLKSYRLTVAKDLPRSGLPQTFSSAAEYRRMVELLVRTGMIEDATKIWWELRLSHRFPTIEMRITDVCTRLDAAVTIAAVYQCVVHMLLRLKRANQRWRSYLPALIGENRWLAQRDGASGALLDFGRGEVVPFAELMEELIVIVGEDAAALGCTAEVQGVRRIVRDGTSADRQLAAYERALASGAEESEGLRAVVDHLIAETLEGCGPAEAGPEVAARA